MKDRILLRNHPVKRRIVLGVFLLSVAILIYGVAVVPARMSRVQHEIAIANLPPACVGASVDFVSDIHVGSLNNGTDNLDRLVSLLSTSDSSAVLLGGDYVILSVLGGTYVDSATFAAHLKPLTRVKPVYAVIGNHDWWKGGPKMIRDLTAAGVTVLEDSSRKIPLAPGCSAWIVGISDFEEGAHDIKQAFSAVVADGSPVIAFTHNPQIFPSVPAALTLAGHTHGGQISLPLLGSPSFWLKKEPESLYINGLYSLPDGRQLFVTPGIGTSILPVRLGVPPEVSKITLKARE